MTVEEVLGLGKKIASELNLDSTCKTTEKWMAHYLAEQISLAEHTEDPEAKAAAETRCVELILRLWEKRELLPRGSQPTGLFKDVISLLQRIMEAPDQFPFRNPSSDGKLDDPWAQLAVTWFQVSNKIIQTSMVTSALCQELGEAKVWVEEHSSALSKEEEEMITLFVGLVEGRIRYLTTDEIPIEKLPPEERNQKVLAYLESLASEQMNALTALENTVMPVPTGKSIRG